MNETATADGRKRREGVFAHWPNRITAIRFVGALALFAALAATGEHVAPDTVGDPWMGACFVLFVFVAATDWLDGHLARKFGNVTAFGRIADPFVDKILVLGTLVLLAAFDWAQPYLPAWIVVAVLAREFLVTGIRGYAEAEGFEFGADRFGKIKLIVQCIAIGALLGRVGLPWPDVLVTPVEIIAHVSVWATLIASVGSGANYVWKGARLFGASR